MLKSTIAAGISFAVIYCVTAAALILKTPKEPIVQPIRFNHSIHVNSEEIECNECHTHVRTGRVAGRPAFSTCMECHDTAASDSPEEHKIRTFKKDIPWKRLFRIPDHVFFSHRRHVTVAKIKCTDCHGPMPDRTSPPPGPLKILRMNDCIKCHDSNGASRECVDCHR